MAARRPAPVPDQRDDWRLVLLVFAAGLRAAAPDADLRAVACLLSVLALDFVTFFAADLTPPLALTGARAEPRAGVPSGATSLGAAARFFATGAGARGSSARGGAPRFAAGAAPAFAAPRGARGSNSNPIMPSGLVIRYAANLRRVRLDTKPRSSSVRPSANSLRICSISIGCCRMTLPARKSQLRSGPTLFSQM